jgi:hypothetical protein
VGEALRTIVVRIDPLSDPLAGEVEHEGEPAVPFVGYMQLIAELERERRCSSRSTRSS